MKLRPQDQVPVVEAIRKAYATGKRCPMLIASTGFGKTVVFSYITHAASIKGNPTLIVAHRKEIIHQIAMSIARFRVPHKVIAQPQTIRAIKAAQFRLYGQSFVSDSAPTMVGSIQTVVSRFHEIDKTLAAHHGGKFLIVTDEGHHLVSGTQWGDLMDRYPSALGLVVTATPKRLDGKGLGKGKGGYVEAVVEAPPMAWLIDNGMLSPYDAYGPPEKVDMKGVRLQMGDFAKGEAEHRMDKPKITGNAITHYRKYADGMRAVVFCVSIKHMQHVCQQFIDAGIPAANIDGAMDTAVRDKAIADFAAGDVRVLCNVNLISEGFDLAAIAQTDVTIDCIIDLSPTQSLIMAMQRWGRALRYKPGKVAVLLDHASNFERHGYPDDERDWSEGLEGRVKGKRKATERDVPVMTCPECFAIHKPAPVCPKCGHAHQVSGREIKEVEGDLVRVSAEEREARRLAMQVERKKEQGRSQTLIDLVELGESRGYKFPYHWGLKLLKTRGIPQDVINKQIQDYKDAKRNKRSAESSVSSSGQPW
jgi:superfamily II DNA or RNA helicase